MHFNIKVRHTLNLHIFHLECVFLQESASNSLLFFVLIQVEMVELLDREALCLGRAAARKCRLLDMM